MNNNLRKSRNLEEVYASISKEQYSYLSYLVLLFLIIIPVFDIPIYYINNQLWYDLYPILMQLSGTIAIVYITFYFIGYIVNKDKDFLSELRRHPFILIFIFFIAWSLISAFNSSNYVYSFIGSFTRHEGFLTYLYYGAIFLCAIILKDNTLKFKLLKAFIAVSVVLCLMMLIQYIHPLEGRVITTNRTAVFFHFNHFGYYLCISLIVLFGLFIQAKDRAHQIIITALIFFEIFTLVINNTFGCFLSVLLSIAAYAIFYIKKNGQYGKRILFLLLVFILSNLIICTAMYKADFAMNIPNSFSNFFKDIGLISDSMLKENVSLDKIGTGRGILWERTFNLITEHPLLGFGPEMLESQYAAFGDYIHTRPANEYLYIAAAMGLPALFLYMGALVSILLIQWKRIRQLSNITILSAACVCGYLISAFFGNSTFYITPYFMMFLGLCAQKDA